VGGPERKVQRRGLKKDGIQPAKRKSERARKARKKKKKDRENVCVRGEAPQEGGRGGISRKKKRGEKGKGGNENEGGEEKKN